VRGIAVATKEVEMSTDPKPSTPRLGRRRFLYLPIGAAGAAVAVNLGGRAYAETDRRGDSDLDVIFRGGTVVDGSGERRQVADVGIQNGYIVKVGDLSRTRAEVEVDATGLVVAPGFIDIHSHAQTSALQQAQSSLTQGVTTEMLQPDGGGTTNIPQVLAIENSGLGINIGAYLPFGDVWHQVVGDADKRPTPAQTKAMQELTLTGLRNGAWGVSAGLFYAPQNLSKTIEVIDVVKAARPWRTNFTNHLRNENDAVIEATAENIEIGETAGLTPVNTHMKVMGPKNWGKSKQTLGLLNRATARGTYAPADVYPYLASSTGLTAIVPAWVQEGGDEAMLARFKDPQQRPRIAQEIEELLLSRVSGPNDVYFPSRRQTLADIAAEMGVAPGEATMRIIETSGSLGTIYLFGNEEDLQRILLNPATAVASDGGATTSSSVHPRRYGTQPRVLGHYVREVGLLTLEDAVRKMTGLPASIIGMVDRGYLAPGMVADVTVFDPDTIIDKGTYDNPRQFSEGVRHVLVNGDFALFNAQLTNVRAGRALRRTGNMPSRPMTGTGQVRASVVGQLKPQGGSGHVEVVFHATGRGMRSNGQLIVTDRARDLTFHGGDFGKLQVTDRWASITGRGRVLGEQTDRSFLVVLDEKDPLDGGKTTVTIKIEGGYETKGVLTKGTSDVSARG
jgi:N-acyl-D-amino-acid deacylase